MTSGAILTGIFMGGLDNCDPVLLDLFRAEMDTHLPALSQGLLALEKGKAGPKDLEAMMRAAHSIKGAARIVGVEAAVRVAHGMEDCFSAAQGQKLTLSSEAVDVLLKGLDGLQSICSPQPDTAMNEQALEALLSQIAAVKDGKLSPPSAPPPAASVVATAEAQFIASARLSSGDSINGLTERDAMRYAGDSHERRLLLPQAFDDAAAHSLRPEFCRVLEQGPNRLRVDFSQVTHMSALALSLLASLAREIAQSPSACTVDAEGVSHAMAVLLRTSGLDRTYRPIG